MPIKAHVKGKRKAPPPPLPLSTVGKLDAATSNEQSSINQSENKFPNGIIGNAPETMTYFTTIQKRKKSTAPLPPLRVAIAAKDASCVNKAKKQHATGDEMNNLSAISKRVSDKSTVKAINLNIFEPNHIRNHFQCAAAKETNEVNVNLDTNHRRHDLFGNNDVREYRNDQVWICNYCTLQNPFWKIICDACERIKPYNTPTINSNINLAFATTANVDNNDSARVNEKNLMTKNSVAAVMMRPKPMIKPNNNDVDKILNRNSMNVVDIKSASSSKELPTKRQSLCLFKYGDQNISPEALEMEKERIRAVIRAMNNRALAQKYPTKVENRNDETKNEVTKKTATINKPGKRRSGLLKYDIEKDYNLPSVRQPIGECSKNAVNDTKENNSIATTNGPQQPIRKIANIDSVTKCNKLIGNTQTHCDDASQVDSAKKLEHDTNNEKHENNAKTTATTKNSIKSGIGNEMILLNLYINFNNAIEAKVQRDMTLYEFKTYIFEKFAPCKNPKIYFNGLLLRNGEHSLAKYGITNQSSLYINTEQIAVQANAKIEKKSVVVQTDAEPEPVKKNEVNAVKNVKPEQKMDEKKVNGRDEKTTTKSTVFGGASGNITDGEKFLIEHVMLNRFLIERVPARNDNINKAKGYRGVYNYHPRCNPEITKILNEKRTNPVKKPPTTFTQTTSKNDIDKVVASVVEVKKTEPITQYIELLSLDDSMDLTKNTEVFECSVCLVDYQPFEGVILRNCLHTFCKDCIRNTIVYSDEAEVKCPYYDDQYSCDCLLQDREIKALLSKTEHDNHLAKSLRIAENQIENSFHCKTPDCKGWCIYEDDVNTFKCPICRLENCLTCRVIHDGLDCKQYQNMMKNNIDKNPENATTHTMLEEMIKKGEAMNCPACKIVLMKKWGCDWLKCSMCKTEICWITRGYRWGPGGKGDTSAGCRCGVDGFRCHPKCNYCH